MKTSNQIKYFGIIDELRSAKKLLLLFLSVCCTLLFIICGASPAFSLEGLNEMEARKARMATNVWPTNQLENASDGYVWQPETLCYTDVATGREVWVLTHGPNIQEIYSREHGSNAWSHDGSKIGFFSNARPTSNTLLGLHHQRWVVNTDGSRLRAVGGFGRGAIPGLADWGWAHTENAYYAFGSSPGEGSGSAHYRLFKMTIDRSNRVTDTTMVLDTSPVNTMPKEPVKEGISTDDSSLVFRDRIKSSRQLGTPNPINTNAVYFASLGSAPKLLNWWGIARGIGPMSDPYGDITPGSEWWFHDVWSPGPSGQWIIGQYEGTHAFIKFSRTGSFSDGGPVFQSWNGTSFGANECDVVSTQSDYGTPDDPYGMPYFGHPVFDRWGRYALVGTYTDTPRPGTRIVDLTSKTLLPNYPLAYNKYDGQHHSWTGWTDYVIGVDPASSIIYANRWNQDSASAFAVADSHNAYASNYNALPRPSQSPDGTKVAFASTFLNGGGDSYPYIQWAVVYYPAPPVKIGSTMVGGTLRLTWSRPSYTSRGWPDESTSPPPRAREIKGYHVWASSNGETGWAELTRGAVQAEHFDIAQPFSTTWYYAVTSEEYSRLESRTLSAVRRVSLDAGGVMNASEYSLQGKTGFWTTPPPAPSPSTFLIPAGGPYRLNWSEPSDSKIRYYNIYYSASGPPTASQQFRIASVPVGTSTYLDWLANTSAPGYYLITSVDRQGNEGSASSAKLLPVPPMGGISPVVGP